MGWSGGSSSCGGSMPEREWAARGEGAGEMLRRNGEAERRREEVRIEEECVTSTAADARRTHARTHADWLMTERRSIHHAQESDRKMRVCDAGGDQIYRRSTELWESNMF
ncbi:hypothetical protein FQA47_003027 [Oryzias melastigma]|uniref:Uncharacterized protein n=1 Tax=Oryzias melastigma TaxID=30732 RepID=A0A834FDR1_ORYME|nr:hypothetical protein FQA47_003027 [Oryzias melastigma]